MRTIVLIVSLFLSTSALADGNPPSSTVDTVWDALSVFEGSIGTAAGDFDCQGISIGIAQWNVGKSFLSVKGIILANPKEQLSQWMPTFGLTFVEALNMGKDSTMTFVRRLQEFDDLSSCDSKKRKARWSNDGKRFVSELKKVLVSPDSVRKQRELRTDVFVQGWRNANDWAAANRGVGATPSIKEVAYFVDMAIFNGGGLQKFGLAYKARSPDEVARLSRKTIEYLETANDDFLLHKIAARKNSHLLKPDTLSDTDRALFALSYEVAMKLNASHARQFRLTVINRRAAILFGKAYYSDRDTTPTQIEFGSLSKDG